MKEDNPYEPPSVDPPADAAQAAGTADQRERDARAFGGLLAFVSFLVFSTVQDSAIVDAEQLWRRGLTWAAVVVQPAPLVCLTAWLIIFHTSTGNRLGLAPLRAVRFFPTLARHVSLWVAWTGVALISYFVSSR
jgi:hypothetical protein